MPILSFRVDDSVKNELGFRAEEAGLNLSEFIKSIVDVFLRNAPGESEDKKTLRLTKLERLFLANQYRILSAVDAVEAPEYGKLIKALEYGYELDYSMLLANFSKGLTKEECGFVLSTLSMFRDLRISFDALKHKDPVLAEEIEFLGFDGNEEGPFQLYVKYFVYDLDRYRELRSNDLEKSFNSHGKMIETYKHMLPVWEKQRILNSSSHKYLLTEDQIRLIVYSPPWKSTAEK